MPGNEDGRLPALAARRLVLEPLERRMLLSGNVTVLVSGVDLIITGDGSDNNIKISQDGISYVDQFELSSPDGTTIDGGAGPRVFSGVFGNIKINMGAGNETVEVADCALPANLIFGGGAGDNTLMIDPSTIAGNLTVTNGTGFDTILLNDVGVGGNITINDGSGGSYIGFDAPPGSNGIVGNVTITNGVGFDELVMNDTDIGGNLTIKNGPGAPLLVSVPDGGGLDGSETMISSSQIGGDLSITNQNGRDAQLFSELQVYDDVRIDNGNGGTVAVATFDGGDSIAFSGGLTEMEGVLIHDDLVIKNGNGVDEQLFTDLEVGDNVSIDNGNGGQTVGLAALDSLLVTGSETTINNTEIDGNLTIKNNTGADLQCFDELYVGHNMSISNGNGGSEITFANTVDTVIVEGNLSITNKSGPDEIYLGPLQVGGNFTINDGTGGTELLSGGPGGSLMVGGNMSITDKTGMGLDLDGFQVNGNLMINSGAGGVDALLQDSLIHGNLGFTATGASDSFTLEGMQIDRNATISDGKGDFYFTSEANLGSTAIGGNLVLKNQGGLLTAVINDTGINGNASITNGSGGSAISFDPLALPFIQGNLTITTGNGSDAVSLTDLTVVGKTAINTGGGDDNVVATTSTFGGALSILLGAGTNDVLTLTSITANSTTSLDGGAGLNDSLTIIDGAFAFAPVYVNFENVTIV